MKKLFFAITLFVACSMCVVPAAQADTTGFAIKPALVQRLLGFAQVPADVIDNAPGCPFPQSVYIPQLAGSTVTIGFPAAGIRTRVPFYLEIDGAAATVMVAGRSSIAIIDGDSRVAASGIFSAIQCIFSVILTVFQQIFQALLTLNIVGILQAIFNGITWLLNCIGQIFM